MKWFWFIMSYFCWTCFSNFLSRVFISLFLRNLGQLSYQQVLAYFEMPCTQTSVDHGMKYDHFLCKYKLVTSEIKWNHDQLRCKYKQAVRFNTCLLSQNLPNWTKTRTSKTSYRGKKQLILHFSDQFQNKLSSTLPVKKQIFDLSENSNKAQYWVGPILLWIQWNITFALPQWITKIVIKIMKFVNGW